MNKITEKAYNFLRIRLNELEKKLKLVTKKKGELGEDYHDEIEYFNELQEEEYRLMDEIKELKKGLAEFKIFKPTKQVKGVVIGSKVEIRFLDLGQTREFTLDGYPIDENYISCNSPLGKAILNRVQGEEIIFFVGKNERKIIIEKILE